MPATRTGRESRDPPGDPERNRLPAVARAPPVPNMARMDTHPAISVVLATTASPPAARWWRRCALPPLAALLTLLAALAGCFGSAGNDDQRPGVGVSVPPHAWLVERLAGDAVRIHIAAPPGASPATHQPSDADMLALKRCALYIRTGVPMEQGSWFTALHDGPQIIDARAGVELREMEDHDHGEPDHHDHGSETGMDGTDPHIWLAPDALLAQVETIATALRELLPERHAQIDSAAGELRAQLEQLDAELQQLLGDHHDKTMLVYHPSWGYLARRYGFAMRAIEVAGKDPTDAELAQLERELAALATDTLFVQPQIHGRGADRLAEVLGLSVVRIDPLRRDVPENLRRVAGLLRQSWSGGSDTP